MNYQKNGFRSILYHFIVFKIKDFPVNILNKLGSYCRYKSDNCILCFGYHNNKKGLMLKLLAFGKGIKHEFKFNQAPALTLDIPFKMLADKNYEVLIEDDELLKNYGDSLKPEKKYFNSKAINKVRMVSFLDPLRDDFFIDRITVILKDDYFEEEELPAELKALTAHRFKARLLESPKQDFNLHAGDTVELYISDNEEEIKAFVDFNNIAPAKSSLEDGSRLEKALLTFDEKEDDETAFHLFKLLYFSDLYLLHIKNNDNAFLKRIINTYGNQPYKELPAYLCLIVPGEETKQLALFSSLTQIKDNNNNYEIVRLPFKEILRALKSEEIAADGFVLNPFTLSLPIPKSFFKMFAAYTKIKI